VYEVKHGMGMLRHRPQLFIGYEIKTAVEHIKKGDPTPGKH
jgi:hypothetical protein